MVFVTAYDQYAVEAFDRQAADYFVETGERRAAFAAPSRGSNKRRQTEAPGDVSGMLKQLAQMLPGNKNAYLRFIRAAHGELVRQIPVEDVPVTFKRRTST